MFCWYPILLSVSFLFLCFASAVPSTPLYVRRLEQQLQSLDSKYNSQMQSLVQEIHELKICAVSCSPSPGTNTERYDQYCAHRQILLLSDIPTSDIPRAPRFLSDTSLKIFQEETFPQVASKQQGQTIQSFLVNHFLCTHGNRVVDTHQSPSIAHRKPDFTGYAIGRAEDPINIVFVGEVEVDPLSKEHKGKAISFAGILCSFLFLYSLILVFSRACIVCSTYSAKVIFLPLQ